MQGFVLTGSGSNSDPSRRGSPADGRKHVHPTRPGIGASGAQVAEGPSVPGTDRSAGPLSSLLRRIDDAFSRTFTAMAMAEDGTRDLALEMLEAAGSGDAAPGDRASQAPAPGSPAPDGPAPDSQDPDDATGPIDSGESDRSGSA